MSGSESPRSVAQRLTELMETVRKPGAAHKKYTDRDVAAAVGCSHTVIFNLRHGNVDPAKVQSGILQGIAKFFGMDANYLQPDQPEASLALHPAAERIALRATKLSPQGLAMLEGLLDQIAQLDSSAAQQRQNPAS